jgi:hypothetical protein
MRAVSVVLACGILCPGWMRKVTVRVVHPARIAVPAAPPHICHFYIYLTFSASLKTSTFTHAPPPPHLAYWL